MKKKSRTSSKILFFILLSVTISLSTGAEDYFYRVQSGAGEPAHISGNTIDSVKAEANSLNFYSESLPAHTQALSGARVTFTTGNLNVMTFNVRGKSGEDGQSLKWNERQLKIKQMLLDEGVDIVGTQETELDQQTWLEENLTGYATAKGVRNNNDATPKGEYNSIFYRTDRFTLLSPGGTFWLSDTPEELSKVPESSATRIATWVKLEDKITGEQIFAINTHIDHTNATAQDKQVRILMQQIQLRHDGAKVVLTGDFNMRPENANIVYISDPSHAFHLLHARDIAVRRTGLTYSYHGCGATPLQERYLADYVFVGDGTEVSQYSVMPEKLDDVYLSDHAPVFAKITFK
ncbi:MAG: endonuclease/exonuclease/phosphatase family protein [Dysgonamonadaceae bacterium]|jgi:endonuclease/exonuclease/phosphatase family metal-dependent hydrolase|nr:endonuclease/exonuclease/phosphatase family protein [Dysgonamonadaceae bacterium]